MPTCQHARQLTTHSRLKHKERICCGAFGPQTHHLRADTVLKLTEELLGVLLLVPPEGGDELPDKLEEGVWGHDGPLA